MIKPYPRPYMDVAKDLYKTLLKLQRILLGSEATTKLQQIDALIVRVLGLRAELTLSLHDALFAEAIYSVVYRCAVRPSLHAFIYTLDSYSYEVRGSGQARTTIPRHA
jgi:hypothetical protein